MKVLLISYYFDPFPGVAAKRASYWAENMGNYDIQTDVLTATEQHEKKNNVIFIPSPKKGGFLSLFIKDEGFEWKKQCKNFFKNYDLNQYDWIIITGGPFLHFSLVTYFKSKTSSKVLLDYRDPFARNPRFENEGIVKRSIKSFLERQFNKKADLISVVNEYCRSLILEKEKTIVVRNGFDESVIKEKVFDNKSNKLLVNAGKFYDDFNLNPLLKVLHNQNIQLHHYGERNQKVNSDAIISHGFLMYNVMVEEINSAEICLLLTGGKSFESPSKLFDYIGLNKKILVISEGELYTGEVQILLQDYPNVVWAKNTTEEITNAIERLKKMKVQGYDASHLSRSGSLIKMVSYLKK